MGGLIVLNFRWVLKLAVTKNLRNLQLHKVFMKMESSIIPQLFSIYIVKWKMRSIRLLL